MGTKLMGGSKRSKMDTSFLCQTVAGRDLFMVELKQKLLSFKYYFNQLHVTVLTTKSYRMKISIGLLGSIKQELQARYLKDIDCASCQVLVQKYYNATKRRQRQLNVEEVFTYSYHCSSKKRHQPQPLTITDITLTVPACTR